MVAAAVAAGSAATASAQDRYTDVGRSSVHGSNIYALEGLGEFDGTQCGARKFCPGEPAERWAIAVWIVRVVDGEDPFPVKESRFADVDDGVWWMPYVERLADLGITVGCRQNPLRFCPDRTVTRAPDQPGAEALADTLLHLTVPHAWLSYYQGRGCAGLPRAPSTEAELVVYDALDGFVPDWYDDNVGTADDLWTLWLRDPSLPALANLSHEFSEFCTNWITSPLPRPLPQFADVTTC